MQPASNGITLSATDLSNFLGCRHRTGLDLAVAKRILKPPPLYADPVLEILRARGAEHERSYVDSLKKAGLNVVDLNDVEFDEACSRTGEAMRSGVDVVVQAGLRAGHWIGKPDILRKVPVGSSLGQWSYEVYDTKLALETRGGTILQLALYSELIALVQGLRPSRFHVVTPAPVAPVQSYRIEEFAAYFRQVRSQLIETVSRDPSTIVEENYPEPVAHCDMCRWFEKCDYRRRKDDHLSFVAGLSRSQREELKSHGVATLEALARLKTPIPFKPSRGSADTYERLRHQAALQLHRRNTGKVKHEMLPVLADRGLCRLPAPSRGDVFLDLEGAHFARDGGREYLFGLGQIDKEGQWAYKQRWACSDAEEKVAFESLIDEMTALAASDPNMHIYHFAPYEPAAMKRLMGRYATRETALDDLLRAERFVDLLAVVRHALRASVESYSIKELEIFYGFTRVVNLRDAGAQRHLIECALEGSAPELITDTVKAVVAGYNEDDCLSTLALRNWLESLRSGLDAAGKSVPRPVVKLNEAPDTINARQKRAEDLRRRLLINVALDRSLQTPEQHARYLLAYLVDWHRREDKVTWWEYYRLRDLPESDLIDERKALSGLEFVERIDEIRNKKTKKVTGSVIDRYRYPEQENELKPGDPLILRDESDFGKIVDLDRVGRTIDVRKRPKVADLHPSSAFSFQHFHTDTQQDAIIVFGEEALDSGLAGSGCQVDLLLRRPPRLRTGTLARRKGETASQLAIRVSDDLDRSVLAIQGPPGTGKTFTGARMICELVKRGRRIGVTGHSHEVIRNLLKEVEKQRGRQRIRIGHKAEEDADANSFIDILGNNKEALDKLQGGELDVVGGTSWLWSRSEFVKSVDVLFVDEAGQMSLANTLAVARAAGSLVLLGDPQQLDQPQKGSHPDGADVSALEHILGGDATIKSDRGIFLDETWRLPPAICRFTSELFYENLLTSRAGLERQALQSCGAFDGAGLWLTPVSHAGNQTSSIEEVAAIDQLIKRLLAGKASWVDSDGRRRKVDAKSVLVIAPYNAQVARLEERLDGLEIRVGTVDKFQGQQAPIVIYSMATSRPEDAPRGMEFLYNLNRLNVATSRAQCACILVASPALFEPECRTPRQMQLANALCRYREMVARRTT